MSQSPTSITLARSLAYFKLFAACSLAIFLCACRVVPIADSEVDIIALEQQVSASQENADTAVELTSILMEQGMVDLLVEGISRQPCIDVFFTDGRVMRFPVLEDAHWDREKNVSGSRQLKIKQYGKRQALIKFDISEVAGEVESAVLRFKTDRVSGDELSVYYSQGNEWEASSVNDSYQSEDVLLETIVPVEKEWVEIEIGHLLANRIGPELQLSFRLSTSGDNILIFSEEADYMGYSYSTSKRPTGGAHDWHNLGNAMKFHGLALVLHQAPDVRSSKGLLSKDLFLERLRYMMEYDAGREPDASGRLKWSHAGVALGIALFKDAEDGALWREELSDEERERISVLMEAFAYAANWCFADGNNFIGDYALNGRQRKTWNVNHVEPYMQALIAASSFFGAEQLNALFTNYDHDAFLAKVTRLKLRNIQAVWEQNSAENANFTGELKTLPKNGSGYGIVRDFEYSGREEPDLPEYNLKTASIAERFVIYYNLAMRLYGLEVVDSVGNAGSMVNPVPSPYLGQIGMLREFDASDFKGRRSDIVYAWDGLHINLRGAATLIALNDWGQGLSEAERVMLENRMRTGIGDFIHKGQQGWLGRSNGRVREKFMGGENYEYVIGMWQNFIAPYFDGSSHQSG